MKNMAAALAVSLGLLAGWAPVARAQQIPEGIWKGYDGEWNMSQAN